MRLVSQLGLVNLAQLTKELRPYLVVGASGDDRVITDVVLYDTTDPAQLKQGDLVLGMGISIGPDLGHLIHELAGHGCAALMIKVGGADLPKRIGEIAEQSGLPILRLRQGVSWMQIALLVRSMLAQTDASASSQPLSGLPAGDLFAVAVAVANLIDAPITIEDLRSRVIAYSDRQELADQARIDSILVRRVSASLLRKLHSEGVFRKLASSSAPVYFQPPEGLLRVAVGVRAGDELIGSVWAAIREPLSPEKESRFAEAANVVAIHMLRHRVNDDLSRRTQMDLVTAIVEGRPDASEAVERLGAASDGFRVMAAWIDPNVNGADLEALRLRLWDFLALHLSSPGRVVLTTLIGSVVFALVPTQPSQRGERKAALELANKAVDRAAAVMPGRYSIGIGSCVTKVEEIPRSRREAELALRVLRLRRGVGRKVAEISGLRTEVLLLELSDLSESDGSVGDERVKLLAESDATQGTQYVASLEAYLDAFGDIKKAGAALGVHANTIRYRIRRVEELASVRLSDPDDRFALMLELRLVRLHNERQITRRK